MRVFVNAVSLEVGPGADVRAAVLAHAPELERKLAAGTAFATDARGIEVPLESALVEGAIIRVVMSARRPSGEPDVDA
jgi:hypothetical protein